MKNWVLSDAGDKWTVKLDVRDLGRHLDTTYRRRAATLVGRVLGLLPAVLVVMALPLDFAGTLRVLRTKFLPGALHAIEASRISFSLLERLRTAFVSAVWCKKNAIGAYWGYFVFCWMVRRAVTLGSMWFGASLGFFVDILRTTLWRFLGCIAYFVWLLPAVLGMVLCTSWLRVFSGSLGIL